MKKIPAYRSFLEIWKEVISVEGKARGNRKSYSSLIVEKILFLSEFPNWLWSLDSWSLVTHNKIYPPFYKCSWECAESNNHFSYKPEIHRGNTPGHHTSCAHFLAKSYWWILRKPDIIHTVTNFNAYCSPSARIVGYPQTKGHIHRH